jgi:hypothetical protein
MTSKEIEKEPCTSDFMWLQEIAYQLAVMNERARYDGGDLPTKPGKNSSTFHYSADPQP